MRRWAKLIVFFATAATMWLVAIPAMAAGPLCDDRGASAIAPTPAIIHPEQSLLALDDDCDHDAQHMSLKGHRAPAEPIVFGGADAALPTSALDVLASPADAPLLALRSAGTPSAGVRTRVDRPPRG